MEKTTRIQRLGNLVKRNKVAYITCSLIALTGAAIYLYTCPLEYESEALVRYKNDTSQSNFQLVNNGETSVSQMIASPQFLTESFADKTNLISYYTTQDYKTHESAYSSPFVVSYKTIGKNFKSQNYEIQKLSETDYKLTTIQYGISRSKTGKFGEELVDNDLSLVIKMKERIPYQTAALVKPAHYSFQIQSPEFTAEQLSADNNQMKVTHKNGVVSIKIRQNSPDKATEIANTIAQHLLITGGQNGVGAEETTTSQIDHKIEILAQELAVTEEQIATYKKEHQITELDFDTEKSLSVLKELQLQKTQIQMNMVTLDNISNYLRKNRETNNSLIEYGAIADPVFSEQMTKLNEKYQSKTAENATSNDAEIETLKAQISERILNTRKRNAIQLTEIKRAIGNIQQQLSMIPEQANTLTALDRKFLLDKKVYDLMVEKRAQLIVAGNVQSDLAQIIKPATVNNTPVSPNNWLVICLALLTGVSIATIFASIKSMLQKTKISQRAELDDQIGIAFIGNIANEKRSPEKWEESFSDLCTRVLLKPETKIITITSSVSGEGKTHIASNFSKAFAAMDKKILVIDMNPFNPEIADHFEITPERTLVDVLDGKCDIHDAVSLTSYPNLDVMTSGNLTAGVNSLLSSRKRDDIMRDLRKHYDLIVIDSPGTSNHIDAIPMMKISDLNLYVVRANTTRRQSVITAGTIKSDYEIDNMYFILNSVTVSKSNKGTGKAYRGRYQKRTVSKEAKVDREIVPTFLRKIALWFY